MNNYAHPEALISTEWLAAHLQDDNLRILEVETNPEQFKDAHIPGAIFWNLFTDLLKPDFSQNLDPAAMATLLSRSGITPETTIIAYGSELGTGSWIFWLLKLLGHRKVRVLNGGYAKWTREGHPVADSLASVAPAQYPVEQLTDPSDSELRILYPSVKEQISSSQQILIDARTQKEYIGEQYMMRPPEGDEKAGHIPGAHHIEHLLAFSKEGTYKSFNDLKALYAHYGATPDKLIVPYCAIGARSASIWFVLTQLLGYPNVRNYDGSWNEWSRQPEAPVETGS